MSSAHRIPLGPPSLRVADLAIDAVLDRTLRDYQDDTFGVVSRGLESSHWMIESPTGSGKTTVGIAILADLLGRRAFTHAIVAAPQRQIEDGFLVEQSTRFLRVSGADRSAIEVPAGFVRAARDGNAKSGAREIVAYLNMEDPGYSLVTTHAALRIVAQNYADEVPAKLRKCLLVVDEAHRAQAPCFRAAVELVDKRGGRLLYLTATPYRADGLPVKLDGMKVYRRSAAEHMVGGRFSPETLRHGIVLYGPDDIETNYREISGAELSGNPRAIAGLAKALVDQWIADGKPKVIIFVPPILGGSQAAIQAILGAFRDAKARTLDASGVGKDRAGVPHQRRFLNALRAERGLTSYRESQFDVVVGGPRLPEGTDWPFCSTVYCVGVSGSMREAVQLIGRAMRYKGQAGYPARHRDVATMKSFVPATTGKALQEMSLAHSRLVTMICVFMADYEAGAGFVLTREVRARLNGGTAGIGLGGGVDDEPLHVEHGLDNETYAMVKAAMAGELDRDPGATYGALWEAGRKAAPNAPDRALNVIVAGFMANGKDIQKVRRVAREKLGPEMRDIDGVVAAMVAELRDVQAGAVAELEKIGVQVHRMTGTGMREWAERVSGPGQKLYEFRGRMMTVAELSMESKIYYGTLGNRLKRMTAEEAVSMEKQNQPIRLTWNGVEYSNLKALARDVDIHPETLRDRLKKMSLEEAVSMEKQNQPIRLTWNGVEYNGLRALARDVDIHRKTLENRLKKMSLEEAVAMGPGKRSPRPTNPQPPAPPANHPGPEGDTAP